MSAPDKSEYLIQNGQQAVAQWCRRCASLPKPTDNLTVGERLRCHDNQRRPDARDQICRRSFRRDSCALANEHHFRRLDVANHASAQALDWKPETTEEAATNLQPTCSFPLEPLRKRSCVANFGQGHGRHHQSARLQNVSIFRVATARKLCRRRHSQRAQHTPFEWEALEGLRQLPVRRVPP